MKNLDQSQVLLLVIVLASALLCVDSASISLSYSSSVSNTYSTTPSFSYSPSNSYSISNSYSTSYSTSVSLTKFLSPSISNTISPGSPVCTTVNLVDRCAPQITSCCLFWFLNNGCVVATNPSYYVCITNSTMFQQCYFTTIIGNEIPQFVVTFNSTSGFVSNNGGSYLFQIFPATGSNLQKGTIGSNPLTKTFPIDSRYLKRVCGPFLCNLICGRGTGTTVNCSWKLGTERIKRVLIYITNALNPITYSPITYGYRKSPYFYKSRKFQQISTISVTCPPTSLCFVKVIVRYPSRLRKTYNKPAQFVERRGFFIL